MQSLDSIVLYPVDRLLKTELRGSKGDFKRPFERSWKDYHEKFNELERQKKKAAKEAGKKNCQKFRNTKKSDEWMNVALAEK